MDRMNLFTTEARYADAWDEYRRRRRAYYVTVACGLALMLGAVSIVNVTGTLPAWFFAIWFLFMVPHMITGLRFVFWHCPRCSNPFHMKGMRHKAFATKCLHCGLPQWAKGPKGG